MSDDELDMVPAFNCSDCEARFGPWKLYDGHCLTVHCHCGAEYECMPEAKPKRIPNTRVYESGLSFAPATTDEQLARFEEAAYDCEKRGDVGGAEWIRKKIKAAKERR
jgi:hypothetical protein